MPVTDTDRSAGIPKVLSSVNKGVSRWVWRLFFFFKSPEKSRLRSKPEGSWMCVQDTHWRCTRTKAPRRAWRPARDAAAGTPQHCWTNTRRHLTDRTDWWRGGIPTDGPTWKTHKWHYEGPMCSFSFYFTIVFSSLFITVVLSSHLLTFQLIPRPLSVKTASSTTAARFRQFAPFSYSNLIMKMKKHQRGDVDPAQVLCGPQSGNANVFLLSWWRHLYRTMMNDWLI